MSQSKSSVKAGPVPAARQFEMDALVGTILQDGVLLSLGLIVVGMVWRWFRTGSLAIDYQIAGTNLFQFVVDEIHLAMRGAVRPHLLINLGIAVLMLTPFIRVAASMVYFMGVLRNWKYTFFTAVVLTVLTYSLFLR
jgi:uncharacterized membrane protein